MKKKIFKKNMVTPMSITMLIGMDDACYTGSAHCLHKQTGSEDIQLMPFAPCKIRLTFLNLIFRSVNDIFQCHSS